MELNSISLVELSAKVVATRLGPTDCLTLCRVNIFGEPYYSGRHYTDTNTNTRPIPSLAK